MRPPLSTKFVEKAQAAITSAVEVYNKPAFAYREETFSLLGLNAWELLLKAKVLKDAGNDAKAIRVYEPRKTKSGKQSKKLYVRRNRAGNAQTISLGRCIVELDKNPGYRLSPEIKANIDALTAIRDNSAHYIHASPVLVRQTLEIGTACVKNFVILGKQWFGLDLSDTLSLCLPLSFIAGSAEVESVVVTADEGRLVKYLQKLGSTASAPGSDFSVAVRIDVKLEKSSLTSASKIQISSDPDAVKVTLSEESIRTTYRWDYEELTKRLADRYSDFKQNSKYHGIRKPLSLDERYVKLRYLDPENQNSSKKEFFNPNIIQVFDAHYTKK